MKWSVAISRRIVLGSFVAFSMTGVHLGFWHVFALTPSGTDTFNCLFSSSCINNCVCDAQTLEFDSILNWFQAKPVQIYCFSIQNTKIAKDAIPQVQRIWTLVLANVSRTELGSCAVHCSRNDFMIEWIYLNLIFLFILI